MGEKTKVIWQLQDNDGNITNEEKIFKNSIDAIRFQGNIVAKYKNSKKQTLNYCVFNK